MEGRFAWSGILAFAVLTANTSLSATMEDLWTDPAGTHSFTFSSGAEEKLFLIDDDAVFDDINASDNNQVVAPASSIFSDNAAVASRHKFLVTPDNGDPSFYVYVVFENTTSNDDYSPLNTLNYALVSDTPMIAGVNYSISNQDSDGTVNYSEFDNLLICFGPDTYIETELGQVQASRLTVGDKVLTADSGYQPIRWISKSSHKWADEEGRRKPIVFRKGSLGLGRPWTELVVSRQHRILVPQNILVAAYHLIDLDGVEVMSGCRSFTFYHIMFDKHEIIFSNGMPTESFFPGSWVLRNLSSCQRAELGQILESWPKSPSGDGYAAARPIFEMQSLKHRLAA